MLDLIARKDREEVRAELQYIPVDKIRPNPYQPRKNFDITALDELAQSIQIHGVMQPITVRPIGAGNFELVAGERRVKASRMVGLSVIPALVVEINDNESAILALIENLQRQDLKYMEEAESYYHLIHAHGFTQEELAQRIGKKQSTVSNKLRLLKLAPMVKKIIMDNDLTERHARALLKLPDEQLQLNVLKTVCFKRYNVSQTEELIEKTIERITRPDNEKKGGRGTNQEQSHKNRFNIKDMRIIINTVKQAIQHIRSAGVLATSQQFDRGDHFEVVISLPKI